MLNKDSSNYDFFLTDKKTLEVECDCCQMVEHKDVCQHIDVNLRIYVFPLWIVSRLFYITQNVQINFIPSNLILIIPCRIKD